jgi:hypothetical protein
MARFYDIPVNNYGLQILDAHLTYADFIAEHPTGEPGDAHLVGTHIYSWNAESNAWIDGGVIVGADGEDGTDGVDGEDGVSPDLQSVSENIVPSATNTFYLGSSTYRWAGVYVGPGTIHITDTVTGDDATLNVSSGVLTINGANQLQVGQLKFVDNTIESTTGSTDIQIGLTSSTGKLVLNRNVTIPTGKKITFGTGRRIDIEPSLAPYGKQTVCVKTVNGKNEMYWGSCSSQGITGGTDYYILATFTNT